jgi:hypothetical protein
MISKDSIGFTESPGSDPDRIKISASVTIRFETEVAKRKLQHLDYRGYVEKDLISRIEQTIYGEVKSVAYKCYMECCALLDLKRMMLTPMEVWDKMRSELNPLFKMGLVDRENYQVEARYPRWVLEDLYRRKMLAEGDFNALMKETVR